jgi:hypothetical protein
MPRNSIVGVLAAVMAGLTMSACGGSSTSPTPTPPPAQTLTITSIVPNKGTAAGTTQVTINGTMFAAGATVTIGGVAATNVTVQSETTIVATANPHSAGTTDVVVVSGGTQVQLANAFTYVTTPSGLLPVISSIAIRGSRTNQPANFADLNEEVTATATLEPNTIPADQLVYQWSAPVGTFTGTGLSVKWKAPAAYQTPGDVVLTLRVSRVIEPALSGVFSPSSTVSVTVRSASTIRRRRSATCRCCSCSTFPTPATTPATS